MLQPSLLDLEQFSWALIIVIVVIIMRSQSLHHLCVPLMLWLLINFQVLLGRTYEGIPRRDKHSLKALG